MEQRVLLWKSLVIMKMIKNLKRTTIFPGHTFTVFHVWPRFKCTFILIIEISTVMISPRCNAMLLWFKVISFITAFLLRVLILGPFAMWLIIWWRHISAYQTFHETVHRVALEDVMWLSWDPWELCRTRHEGRVCPLQWHHPYWNSSRPLWTLTSLYFADIYDQNQHTKWGR